MKKYVINIFYAFGGQLRCVKGPYSSLVDAKREIQEIYPQAKRTGEYGHRYETIDTILEISELETPRW